MGRPLGLCGGFRVRAAPHGPNYGKVALVRMYRMMSVGCMQSLVRQLHRRAEVRPAILDS